MTLYYGQGDLLQADVEALVNAVNCVGVMGKGIALQFRRTWPSMFRAYKDACTQGRVAPGKIHIWENTNQTPKYILNVPTKRHWRSKSRLLDVLEGIQSLALTLDQYTIQSVAIPPLGAGLGGLDWNTVRPHIVALSEARPSVDVWLWEPGFTP